MSTPPPRPLLSRSRSIALVIYPGVQPLDAVGPYEVFAHANRAADHPAYDLQLIAPDGAILRSESGLALVPDRSCADAPGPFDTLMVAGGYGVHQARQDRRLIDWLARTALACRRIASVCSGTFLLAEAGLLTGRRVTTHWRRAAELAKLYPQITVDPLPIFIEDGPVYTSAGVSAGLDLALALVEADLGRTIALTVARQLVLFLKRPGNQAQFSATLHAQSSGNSTFDPVICHIVQHPAADLSVPALAAYCGLSERSFARRFRTATGTTPAAYVARVRLESARRLLDESALPVKTIAHLSGFRSADVLSRSFASFYGCPPADYRQRFASTRPLQRSFAETTND